jgi:lambda family phage tail tape measure protein
MARIDYVVGVNTKGAMSSLASLEKSIASIGAATIAGFAVGEIVAFGDSIVGLQNKLRSLTGDQALVGSMFNDITRIAGAARAPLQETGDLYFRIARAARDLGISQQQTSDITESLAKSMSMTGATAQETSGALLQLGQALQSGRFQGDELRSVLENMPIVSKAMADELGVTIGELRKLGSEGKITSDVFVRAMEKNKKAIDDAFARSVPTATQALNNLRTAFGIAFSEMATEDGPGKVFAKMIEDLLKLTKDVNALADTIKDLANIILYAGIAFLTLGKNALVMKGIAASINGVSTAFRAMASGSAMGLMARNFKGVKNSITGITMAFGPFNKATGQIMVAAKNAGALGKAFSRVLQVLFSVFAILGNVLRIAFRFAGWIGVVMAVAQAVDFLIQKFFKFSVIDDYVMPLINKLWYKMKQFATWLAGLAGIKIDIMSADPSKVRGGSNWGSQDKPDPGANTVFGDASTKISPKDDSAKEKADEAKKKAEEQAKALRDVKDAILEITAAYRELASARLDDLKFQLASLGMSEDQIELEQNRRDILKEQSGALKDLAEKTKQVEEAYKNEEITKKGRQEALALIAQETAAINAAADAQVAASEKEIKAIQAGTLAIDAKTKAMELSQLANNNRAALQGLEDQLTLVGLYGDKLDEVTAQIELQQRLREIELEFQNQLLDLENRKLKLGEQRYAMELAMLNQGKAQAIEAANAVAAAEKKVDDARKKSERNDIGSAFGKRFEELERSVDPAVTALQGLDSLFNNMGNALDNFVETGKFKFGDFAKSIIADLAKIALKAAVTKLFTLLGKSLLGGRAAGGPVMANKPYVVGEQGPELFVPNSAGSIATNASMNKNAGAGSGMGATVNNTYITNNISAIDSRSVAQMFVENRKSLLGASMMARKETPYGG